MGPGQACFAQHITFSPDPLQTWAQIALVCGILLLVETLLQVIVFFTRRRQTRQRWLAMVSLLLPLGGGGALFVASYAYHQYWYYATQFTTVLGPHPGEAGHTWSCMTQQAVNQVQALGVITLIGTTLLVMAGAVAMILRLRRGGGHPMSAIGLAEPSPEPA